MVVVAGALALVHVPDGQDARILGVISLIHSRLALIREPLPPELVTETIPASQLRVRVPGEGDSGYVDLEVEGLHRNDQLDSLVLAISLYDPAPVDPLPLDLDPAASDEVNLGVLADHARDGAGVTSSLSRDWNGPQAILCRLWNPPPRFCMFRRSP